MLVQRNSGSEHLPPILANLFFPVFDPCFGHINSTDANPHQVTACFWAFWYLFQKVKLEWILRGDWWSVISLIWTRGRNLFIFQSQITCLNLCGWTLSSLDSQTPPYTGQIQSWWMVISPHTHTIERGWSICSPNPFSSGWVQQEHFTLLYYTCRGLPKLLIFYK